MVENKTNAEDIQDVESEMTPEQIKENRKNLVALYKSNTVYFKHIAEYEEVLERIAVARRNRAVAEYEFAKLMSEQKIAEEKYQQQLKEEAKNGTKEKSQEKKS